MNPETKNCQNCKYDFTIEPDDFSFYEKINVPPPTFCPECRMFRRLSFRNERVWYRRTCAATGQSILTIYHPDSPYIVYEQNYWKSDEWTPLDYGQVYDFNRGFFEQFDVLIKKVPHPNLIQKNCVNSDYSNYVLQAKNCYYCASVEVAEDSAYLFSQILNAKNCFDAHFSSNIEYCYEVVDCRKSNRLFYSQNCEACIDSFFLYDCRNCLNCFGCAGLRNKSYCIFNEQYTKEEYAEHLKNLWSGSNTMLVASIQEFEKIKQTLPRKFANIINSVDVSGDDIINARNCKKCFVAQDNVENCKYAYRVWGNSKDGMDIYGAFSGAELFYEVVSITSQRVFFSMYIWGGYDIEYSYNCFDCNNVFGCVGLRNKSYCVFNIQYSKEEYEKIVLEIKDSMRKSGEYGEFFPISLSPFSYNETIAQDYFPLSQDEAKQKGYTWREPDNKNYKITISVGELPDNIKDVSDLILNEVIACEHEGKCNELCATAFRLTQNELQFYRTFNLPLPRLCPSCRHFSRVKLKNPLRLWQRSCMCNNSSHDHDEVCPNEFETSYAPDRPEKVFCESCYQKEVL